MNIFIPGRITDIQQVTGELEGNTRLIIPMAISLLLQQVNQALQGNITEEGDVHV